MKTKHVKEPRKTKDHTLDILPDHLNHIPIKRLGSMIGFRCADDLKDELQEEAKKNNTSMSKIILKRLCRAA